MKGTELMPQCGYSRKAIARVQKHRADVDKLDVLEGIDPYRQALSEPSDRATVPP